MYIDNSEKKDLIEKISKINADSDSFDYFKNTWFKQFIISDLTVEDKVDILTYARPVLMDLKKSAKTRKDRKFFSFIKDKKYHDAVWLCNYLSYEYPEKREYVKSLVKKRDIYLLSPKLEMEMGGLGHTIRHRANYLDKEGYNVIILNAGPIKNYPYILDYYHSTNGLSPNIAFYNLYEHYSKKFTIGDAVKSLDESVKNSPEDIIKSGEFNIKRISNSDNSITLKYYIENPEEIIKEEIYIDDALIYKDDDEFSLYYTPDGFNYLKIDKATRKVYLNDRFSDSTIEFNALIPFLYHYINEIALQSSEKPFIICDATTQWYNMNGVSLKHAYKIGSLHGNPFIDFDVTKDLNPKVNHFQKIHLLDKVVLLTQEMKDDLVSRVDEDKLTVIPNFLLDEQLEYEEVEKDLTTISIFSRIAPIKQLSHIIKAFKMVCDEKDNLKLDIYGGTASKAEENEWVMLENLSRELGIEDKVELKGYCSDVAPIMRKNLFTLLSSRMEGLPMSIIESMANSAPVISYDVKYGPKDIITDHVDGIIVSEGDIEGLAKSMLELLNNPDKAIEMGKAAKEKIKNSYSISSAGKQWEDLFIDLFIEKEVNDYFESITIKNRYNKSVKDNKKLKEEIKALKKQLKEPKTEEQSKPGGLKRFFKKG